MHKEIVVMNQDVHPPHFLGWRTHHWVTEYPDAQKFDGIRAAKAARKNSGTLNAKIIENYGMENETVIG